MQVIDKKFSAFVDDVLSNWGVKGLSLAIVHSDIEVEYGTWGVQNEEGDKVASKTLFGLGSCSKAFVGASLAILIDDFAAGKNVVPLPEGVTSFTWRSRVKDLLQDEWKLQDEWAESRATLQDILSHVTGIPGHDLSYGRADTTEGALKRFPYLQSTLEFREGFQYNNLMYAIGAHIVAKYSNSSLPDFVKNRIFIPLDMSSSTYYYNQVKDQFAHTFTPEGRRIPYWLPDETIPLIGGAGGVISNAIDMAKWLKMLLNSGKTSRDGVEILSKTTFESMVTATSVANGGNLLMGYGKGWARRTHQGHGLVTHDGGCPGVSSYVGFLPSDGFGVVVLTNVGERNNVSSAVGKRAIEKALNLKESPVDDVQGTKFPPWADDAVLPSLPLLSYAGSYMNPGYGDVTICSPDSTSECCKKVLADFRIIDSPDKVHEETFISTYLKERPMLYSAWTRLWCTHIRLSHDDKESFIFQITNLFPRGYGQNETPFELVALTGVDPRAQFVIEGGQVIGFGLFGVVREGTSVGGEGGVKERADVWFDKVESTNSQSSSCTVL